jgi:hypothetical protein
MANNFYNAVVRNVSADSTLPTEVYKVPDTKKAILIELDVANKSSAGVTVTVQMLDESQNQTYDTTGTTINANASTVAVSTGVSGLFTTNSSAAHNLIVNDRVYDRVVFTNGTDPSFTNASLPASGDAALSETRKYYVKSIPSTSTFTIAETKDGTLLTFDTTGAGVTFAKIHLADIVKDAPVPVGGSLKVISGQKLVIEPLKHKVNSVPSFVSAIVNVLVDGMDFT